MMPGSILRIVAIVALVGQSLLVGREVARGFVCPHPDSGPITAAGWSDMGSGGPHAAHAAHHEHAPDDGHTDGGSEEPSPCECGADCSLCPPPFAPTVQPLALAFAFDPTPSIPPIDTDHGFVRVRVAYLHPPATAPPLHT